VEQYEQSTVSNRIGENSTAFRITVKSQWKVEQHEESTVSNRFGKDSSKSFMKDNARQDSVQSQQALTLRNHNILCFCGRKSLSAADIVHSQQILPIIFLQEWDAVYTQQE
jgi:hypothetical protein